MNDNSAKAFAFGCADGSIHVYAVGQDEVSDQHAGNVGAS
jgi:hypothetical protein